MAPFLVLQVYGLDARVEKSYIADTGYPEQFTSGDTGRCF